MEWFKQIWEQVSTVLKWWVIILPWESGLRIRLGKKIKILKPGIHFRIPYIDSCYRQAIRLNFVNLAPQTLTAKTGETMTVSLIVGYCISDILKVYNSVSEIESAICGNVMGNISDFISTSELDKCRPSDIERQTKDCLLKKDWGINVSEVKITSYAIVKTFRLIQDNAWMSQSHRLNDKV